MSRAATTVAPAPAEAGRAFVFGTAHRPRRRALPASTKSDAELIAEYLARKPVTKCKTLYADGAVKASGAYDF